MNKPVYNFLSLMLLVSLLAAPLKAQIPHLIFHAELSGSEAIPAVNTDGKALVTLLYTPDRTKVTVSGMLVRLEGTVTEAKIHIGKPGQTGAVLLDLMPLIDGRRIVGQLNAPPELLQNLLPDQTYAEIKTTAHPNGEIRGQFLCETDVDFGVNMTGDQVVPASGSNAVVFGGVHFPLGAADLIYAFTFNGLSGPVTSLELYEGQPGQNGVRVKILPKPVGNIVQGLLWLDTMPTDFVRKLREGKYYFEIRTSTAATSAEVRGHINHLGYFCSVAPVNGVQQVPSQFTPGFGFSHTRHSAALDSLSTLVYFTGIMPTSVKIHIGNPGEIGTDFVTLDPLPIAGYYFKKYKIAESQLTDFAQGRLYINVTTATFPNGEIRGVLKNTLRKGYAFDLCGSQMVPPVNSFALGVAVASVDQANCYLNYKMITDALHGFLMEGNIAQGVFGVNGTNTYPLPLTDPIIAGDKEIMTTLGPVFESEGMYMQLNTSMFPDGEIRGQIRRGLTCPDLVAVNELDNVGGVVVSPVPFKDVLNIELESNSAFDAQIVVRDIMGVVSQIQPVQIVSGKQSIQIQTAYLTKGMYTLSLESAGQNTSMLLKKVVKVD